MNQLEIRLLFDPDRQRLESDMAAAQGMSQSAAHAEAVAPGFTERAYGLLAAFCKLQGMDPFTSEDFRLYAHQEGFPMPVPKALGAVFKRAAREGLIRRDGFGKAFARHGSPCPRWSVCQPSPYPPEKVWVCTECHNTNHEADECCVYCDWGSK